MVAFGYRALPPTVRPATRGLIHNGAISLEAMTTQEQSDQQKSEQIRAVILDYGLVLCQPPRQEHIDKMATAFGVDHQTFWRLYEQNRGPLDKGDLTPAAFWKSLARDAGTKVD